MKTIDWLVDNEPAGTILSTDRFLIQRSGASKGGLISNLITAVLSGLNVSAGDLTDITPIGEDLVTAVDGSAARAAISAANVSHTHSISDIDEYDVGALSLTSIEFSGSEPTSIEENMLWVDNDELLVRLDGETHSIVKRTIVINDTDDLVSDASHLNNIVSLSSDSKNIEYTLDEIPGARVGDTIIIVNTGSDSNDVQILDGTDAMVLGVSSNTIQDNESLKIFCLDAGTPQKWFRG